MERTGEVTAVKGEYIEVTFCRPSECEKCHACMGGEKKAVVLIPGKARVGDLAVVSMPAQTIMKASLMAYVIPLAGLFVGMFAGAALFPAHTSTAALTGGLIGLGIPLLALGVTEKRRRSSSQWQPTLMEVIPNNNKHA